MERKLKLGCKKAVNIHHNIVNSPNAYSLTLTLKPYYQQLPIHEQYTKIIQDIRRIFTLINRTFNIAMFSPELNKANVIHIHCYLVLPLGEDHLRFEQSLKRHRTKAGVIGPNYKLKIVDEITERLLNYPFKDIERTLYVKSRIDGIGNLIFDPYHLIIQGYNSWKII